MLIFQSLKYIIESYLSPQQCEFIERAYRFAYLAHEGVKRASGEPYITHPIAVARILAEMHMDHKSIVAAILHDVIEDTGIPKSAIGEQFGADVAFRIGGHRLDLPDIRARAEEAVTVNAGEVERHRRREVPAEDEGVGQGKDGKVGEGIDDQRPGLAITAEGVDGIVKLVDDAVCSAVRCCGCCVGGVGADAGLLVLVRHNVA